MFTATSSRARGSGGGRDLSGAFVMVLERREGAWLIARLMWHLDRSPSAEHGGGIG